VRFDAGRHLQSRPASPLSRGQVLQFGYHCIDSEPVSYRAEDKVGGPLPLVCFVQEFIKDWAGIIAFRVEFIKHIYRDGACGYLTFFSIAGIRFIVILRLAVHVLRYHVSIFVKISPG
jgi:hypothetical protein